MDFAYVCDILIAWTLGVLCGVALVFLYYMLDGE